MIKVGTKITGSWGYMAPTSGKVVHVGKEFATIVWNDASKQNLPDQLVELTSLKKKDSVGSSIGMFLA